MDAVGCRTIFSGLINMFVFDIFLKFLVGASRLVVDTLHPLAPPCLRAWLLSEPPGTIYFRTKL
jgi:hypothetical protein